MKIIVGVDAGPRQPDALHLARRLAADLGAEPVVAHVFPDTTWTAGLPEYEEHVEGLAREVARAAARSLGGDVRAVATRAHSVPRGLHAVAADEGAETIVIASSHRSAPGRILLGEHATRIVQRAPCAVVIAPHGYEGATAMRTVAAAIDGTDESRAAAGLVAGWARALRAGLELVSVVPTLGRGTYVAPRDARLGALRDRLATDRREALDALAAGLASVRVTTHVVVGPLVETLVGCAAATDLLAVGSRGSGPVGHVLLGDVAMDVVHRATVPVLVLPRCAATPSDVGAAAAVPAAVGASA